MVAEHDLEVVLQTGYALETAFAAAPFFRERPSGKAGGGFRSSARPRRMVRSEQSNRSAMYVMPPCPNLKASIAA
jgi:hypothetical protein